MQLNRFLAFLFISIFPFVLEAQNVKLLSGPIVGSITAHSTKIWIAYQGKSDNIVALYDSFRREVKLPTKLSYIKNKRQQIVLTMTFGGLNANTKYNILVKIGKDAVDNSHTLSTISENLIEDFQFMVGSCFLIMPDGLGKTFLPGKHKRILKPMIAENAAFNLWLGDNCYYVLGEWNSYEKMFKRQLHMRTKNKLYSAYLSSRPNYAIWDDHDFGPNDCDDRFPLRDTAYRIFTNFWANESWGTVETKGTFGMFTQHDASFFLTDDRYYRSEKDDSIHGSILGEAQVAWLKASLLASTSTFKFIVTGSQVLNRQTEKECWISDFPNFTNDILNFIKVNHISGVIFLTGDRHLTHLIKDEQNSNYPLYDFTCSPVLSFTSHEHEMEMNNPQVIPGTLIQDERNYGKISITGEAGNRVCTLFDFDEYGNLMWQYAINEKDLR